MHGLIGVCSRPEHNATTEVHRLMVFLTVQVFGGPTRKYGINSSFSSDYQVHNDRQA